MPLPPNPFTEAEARELARLLEKVQRNNWFIPEAAFVPFHKVSSVWAPELVILKESPEGKRILLAKYEEGESPAQRFFGGSWHIPGGYNRWEENIQTTCSRIALRELGLNVICHEVLDAYKWGNGEHPYGRPLSLYIRCESVGTIEENDRRRFFPVETLPEPIVKAHQRFIQTQFCS